MEEQPNQPPISFLEAALSGHISANRFILENLYALVLKSFDDPGAMASKARRQMLADFEDLPAASSAGVDGETAFLVRQHGLHQLERFWDAVEARVASSRQP